MITPDVYCQHLIPHPKTQEIKRFPVRTSITTEICRKEEIVNRHMRMYRFTKVLTYFIATCVGISSCTEFSDCGNNEVKAIRSVSCDESSCRAPIGGLFEVEVDFIPTVATEKVTISVFASVFGFQVNLPLDDDDACAEGRLQCPIKPGKHETLKYRLKIKDDYYPVSGDVGFKLSTPEGTTIACATLSAELYSREDEPKDEHQEL